MTAHEMDNMVCQLFPESLSEAHIAETNENAIPISTEKAMKFGLGVFQGGVSISQEKQKL